MTITVTSFGKSFAWAPPSAGFEIVRWKPRRAIEHPPVLSRWLVPRFGPSAMTRNAYEPLSLPGLFLEFAAISPSDDGEILSFANRYGPLVGARVSWSPEGSSIQAVRAVNSGALYLVRSLVDQGLARWIRPKDALPYLSEALGFWSLSVAVFKESITLWDAIRAHDKSHLKQLVSWDPRGGLIYMGDVRRIEIAATQFSRQVRGWLDGGRLDRVAGVALAHLVSSHLSQHSLVPGVRMSTLAGPVLEYIPDSLLGALWLQLGRAIESGRRYRKCEAPRCSIWFEVNADRRTDTRYCNASCRQQAQRDRKKRARILSEQGLTVAEISGRTGSAEESVRRWLS